ncbi:MAG: hypothetical protein IJH81_08065 [Lachnospiraceae bacterium]|nr:hypothetical protein [Lachnospiraceae bacterium]
MPQEPAEESAVNCLLDVLELLAATAGDLLKYLQGAACWMYGNCLQQPRGIS